MLLHRFCLAIFVCGFAALGAPRDPAQARARAVMARLPLRFETNQGQWSPEVRYAARGGDATLFLTERGPVLATRSRRVEISFVHGNSGVRVEALDRLPAQINYLVGSRQHWHTGVASFTRVVYRSIYPGIDAVYYGNQNQLEYDLMLRPGADPRSIRLQFRGADHLRFTPEGDLSVETGGEQFIQKRPLIYQEDSQTGNRRAVNGRYQLLAGKVVGVQVDAYDRSRPLVVDPVVRYAGFVGGGATDAITAIKADSKGHMVVAGYTSNYDLQATDNAAQGSNASGTDCFIAILDPNAGGSVLYLSYLGGSRDDSPMAISLDAAGHIYLTGTTTSSDFPMAGNSVQTSLHLSTTSSVFTSDAFVAEIDPTTPGGLLYSTYMGGAGTDIPRDLAVDSSGNMYIVGYTESSDLPVTGSAYAGVLYGPNDAFLAKLDPNSTTLAYASYLGGEGRDDGRSIAVSAKGLVYFAATTLSQQFPLAGPAYSGTLNGPEDTIIGVMDMAQSGTASLVYATYFGGSDVDEVRKIALDGNGKLLLTGWTLSRDFPVTQNAVQVSSKGAGDAFLARVNVNAQGQGFIEYSTYLGGSGGDVAYDLTIDSSGAVYLSGYTLSTDFPVSSDAAQRQYGNGIEAFVLKLDLAVSGPGAVQYGTFLGGSGVHVGNGIAISQDGSVYVGGYTTSDFPVPALQNSYFGGSTDGFVVVLK